MNLLDRRSRKGPKVKGEPAPRAIAGPVVEALDIWKSFGSTAVLRGVSLSVDSGQVVCVIGPSGSGKTTLLRCLNHLETVDKGSVRVNGELVGYHERANGQLVSDSESETARKRRHIGFVFQRFNLWPHLTALRNVIEAPVHVLGRSVAEAEAEARALLERVGLGDKCENYPATLSGGQQQRVAIARAAATGGSSPSP
ncbi:MAG: amino acid ABC transporter ATP-binding protein, partial [Actinobacteria bacterium]|nr:amino acid ABC transporter ATP-binding protein [Actinomycetota bacterium]